jgi:integrase
MTPPKKAPKRSRGEIEALPSGSLRVRVYAGKDAVTGKRNYLVEIVPSGPRAAREAEKVRTRLLNQVDEQRHVRTNATVDQLMDRYLEAIDVEETSWIAYEGHIRNHIRPLLGAVPLAKLNGETLDSFDRVLRTCRTHCRGKQIVDHRTDTRHKCDARCKPHEC